MAKHRSNLTLPALLSIAALGAMLVWRSSGQTASIEVLTEPSPSPELTTTGTASDGKISLSLNQKPAGDNTTWTLTLSDKNSNHKIWSETLPTIVSFSIPKNAVSPDNKYLFIREVTPDKTLYLVFTTSGKPMTKDSQYVEFADLFSAKYPNLKITEATGWGGLNLIVFNTDKVEGGTGPSFWFEIPSQSFIQLSNRFN
jgi:hypothetical protein